MKRPVDDLWGVGQERARLLAKLEVRTIEDLLLLRPRRYEDRRHLKSIGELKLEDSVITRGRVLAAGVKWFRKRTKSLFEMILDDGTGHLYCRWWNLPYMEKYFAPGDEVVVFGKVKSLKPRSIDHPETEVVESADSEDSKEEKWIHLNRITPIYPLTEGLPQRWLRALIFRTLERFESQVAEPWPNSAAGPQPISITRAQAVRWLHFPEGALDADKARRRLAFDELVRLQIQIQARRRNFESKAQALPNRSDNRLIKPFLSHLGFKLTEAQTSVLRELRKDLSGQHPMRRLLQGDVGSGKTVVAACCGLMAIESGYTVALMAPTEILAEQHFLNFSKWFEPLRIPVELQTGAKKISDPSLFTNQNGTGRMLIGTHALFTDGFDMPNLGLVIIDEQHKFGVTQREKLVRKGQYPHLLVMTATPIPRTLGLTLYGELDVSTIREAPPGRGKIVTSVRTVDKLAGVWDFVRDSLRCGRQAYVVYPRVEESGPGGIKAATREFDSLKVALKPFQVGLMHGRLASAEKESVMNNFRANRLQVLLATSLIEVGVDVPNATVMVIENAEMFGLAQLHQLRGRIGRGAHDSFCILVAAAKSPESRQRLKVLEETTDGFKIAEADLKLRGPGELLGQQQSGLPNFRFADLVNDFDLIELARDKVKNEGLVSLAGNGG